MHGPIVLRHNLSYRILAHPICFLCTRCFILLLCQQTPLSLLVHISSPNCRLARWTTNRFGLRLILSEIFFLDLANKKGDGRFMHNELGHIYDELAYTADISQACACLGLHHSRNCRQNLQAECSRRSTNELSNPYYGSAGNTASIPQQSETSEGLNSHNDLVLSQPSVSGAAAGWSDHMAWEDERSIGIQSFTPSDATHGTTLPPNQADLSSSSVGIPHSSTAAFEQKAAADIGVAGKEIA